MNLFDMELLVQQIDALQRSDKEEPSRSYRLARLDALGNESMDINNDHSPSMSRSCDTEERNVDEIYLGQCCKEDNSMEGAKRKAVRVIRLNMVTIM